MKNLAIIVAAFFISTTLFSQELDLGIKLGSNFASISDAQQGSSSELDFRQVLLRVLNLVKKQQYNWMFCILNKAQHLMRQILN